MVVPSPAASEVLRGRFLDELRAHVLIRVGQLDFLGDRHAVLGDRRAAPALVDHARYGRGAQRAPHGPGQFGHAAGQLLAGLVVVGQNLRHDESPSSLSHKSAMPHPADATREPDSDFARLPKRLTGPTDDASHIP